MQLHMFRIEYSSPYSLNVFGFSIFVMYVHMYSAVGGGRGGKFGSKCIAREPPRI